MREARARSSLPLRGIETTSRGSLRLHCRGPHCPYEGLKPLEIQQRAAADGSPHCPYEGLKRDSNYATGSQGVAVLIAPTRD